MVIRPSRRGNGVTLIEMMIVVGIVALLAAIGAPSLSEFVIKNRLDSTANEFMTALALARSEAVRRGGNVEVRSAAGSATREWTKGWDVVAILSPGTEAVRAGRPVDAPMTLYSSRNTSTIVRFLPTGRVDGGAPNDYVFILCYAGELARNKQPRSRAVIVNDSGRIRLAQANGDGQPVKDTASGTAVVTSCTNP